MDELQQTIGTWAEQTFGHAPGKVEDIPSCIAHLEEELQEFKATRDPVELADMAILLFTLSHILNIWLSYEVKFKHRVNLTRKWAPPDERGVVHHL